MSENKTYTVTYKAPAGDAKVTEMYGMTFHDGKPETVELTEDQYNTLSNNPVFEVSEGGTLGKRYAAPKDEKHDKEK